MRSAAPVQSPCSSPISSHSSTASISTSIATPALASTSSSSSSSPHLSSLSALSSSPHSPLQPSDARRADGSGSGDGWWECPFECGQQYRRSSGRSIRRHINLCFRLHNPSAVELSDEQLSHCINQQQASGQLTTGLRRWKMRQPRRLAEQLADHDRWDCVWGCTKSYRATSSRSIQRHANSCYLRSDGRTAAVDVKRLWRRSRESRGSRQKRVVAQLFERASSAPAEGDSTDGGGWWEGGSASSSPAFSPHNTADTAAISASTLGFALTRLLATQSSSEDNQRYEADRASEGAVGWVWGDMPFEQSNASGGSNTAATRSRAVLLADWPPLASSNVDRDSGWTHPDSSRCRELESEPTLSMLSSWPVGSLAAAPALASFTSTPSTSHSPTTTTAETTAASYILSPNFHTAPGWLPSAVPRASTDSNDDDHHTRRPLQPHLPAPPPSISTTSKHFAALLTELAAPSGQYSSSISAADMTEQQHLLLLRAQLRSLSPPLSNDTRHSRPPHHDAHSNTSLSLSSLSDWPSQPVEQPYGDSSSALEALSPSILQQHLRLSQFAAPHSDTDTAATMLAHSPSLPSPLFASPLTPSPFASSSPSASSSPPHALSEEYRYVLALSRFLHSSTSQLTSSAWVSDGVSDHNR